jgi:hypothetical protein
LSPFRRRTVVILSVVAGLSLASALLWGVFGGEIGPVRSAQADAFSRSALGHSAFVALLRQLRIPVVLSRNDSAGKARHSTLLVVAEPRLGDAAQERALRLVIGPASAALLVLPKWQGVEDAERPGWISAANLVGRDEVEQVLDAAGIGARLVRVPAGEPVGWDAGGIAVRPSIVMPQLLEGGGLEPVIRCRQGILAGWAPTRAGRMLVLADPDLLSNHGLLRPGNAAAAIDILEEARRGREAVVIDETLHGFGRDPGFFRMLFDYPLVLASIQSLLVVAVLLWAAMGRFGAPEPHRPDLEEGKETLVENIAMLLRLGDHSAHALERYLGFAVAEVRAALHVPDALPAPRAAEWLDGNAAARGLDLRLADLEADVGRVGARRLPRALPVALRIHRWRKEMVRGRDDGP